jgi:Flp pilus assembly protein TadG
MLGKNGVTSTTALLQRLRKNNAGNTFAMAAAAMFPIVGLVGGGVDIGRAYMAKARLQLACDAGALAARRNMTQDTMTAADIAEANKYFSFNFPEGSFDSTDFDETVVDSDGNVISANVSEFVDGASPRTVVGNARTTIQTTLMKIFGYQHMVIAADCSSRLDVGNVDVMMVLDVTGSMGSGVSGGGTRLAALQESVEAFYDILGPGGGSSGEQIRYGFVPYSSAVNVGSILYNANPAWLAGGTGTAGDDIWSYQSRRPVYEVTETTTTGGISTVVTYETIQFTRGGQCRNNFSLNNATRYRREGDNSNRWWYPSPSGNPVVSGNTTITYSHESWGGDRKSDDGRFRTCVREVSTETDTTTTTTNVYETYDGTIPGAVFKRWDYRKLQHDVSAYVNSIDPSNPAAQRPTETGVQMDRWDGCIEERTTDNTIVTATTTIPAGALDLNIDLVPTDAASRWGPFWRDVMYDRSSSTNGWEISKSGDSAICPPASRKLASYTAYDEGSSDDLQSYIDGLQAQGFTNHAIGMIWGARLLSDDGLFAAENSSAPNGFSIGRHIVFMTDGSMTIRTSNYDSYGLATQDDRIAAVNASNSELESRQAQRFQLMCRAARAKGWTIWVVQFGVTTVTSNMENCASSADHATPASNRADMISAFSNIAQKIGGLRLDE